MPIANNNIDKILLKVLFCAICATICSYDLFRRRAAVDVHTPVSDRVTLFRHHMRRKKDKSNKKQQQQNYLATIYN